MSRVDAIRELIRDRGVDGAIISRLTDIRWACGFTGSNGLLIVLPDRAHFVTDGRYTTQAAREVEGAQVHIAPADLETYITEHHFLPASVLFQADDLTFARVERLKASGGALTPASGLLARVVSQKSEDEIARIRRAQAITEATFDHLLNVIRPGLTEKEVAAEIVYDQLRRGAERMSFEPIVAAGANGALPHARPSDRPISHGDMIVLDFGCVVDGYASDMTRTIAVGEPDEEAVRAYEIVLEAKRTAIARARPGMLARDLDAVARSVIGEAGLGSYFNHGLGHGVGLQTHEWPRVSHSSDDVLPESAVITIEPGVYLPEAFGIRIEDMIVLRRDGAEVLTSTPDTLIRL